jgi:hypothetical protein
MVLDIIGKIIGGATGIIDKVVPDPNLAEKLKHELTSMGMNIGSEEAKAEIEAKRDIIVQELKQNDKYTKRARPTVVYGGLFFIFINYVLFPVVSYFIDGNMPKIEMPEAFWWAWSSVIGIYSIGRSAEKLKSKSD